jgi:hypothetical protein
MPYCRQSRRIKSSLILLCVLFAGCTHSRGIRITVTNTGAGKISAITIDYPEATFGINSLDPGKSFQYGIKPTATGALKIEFLDARGVDHVSAGPVMHKNDEGTIQINLTQDGAQSEAKLMAF